VLTDEDRELLELDRHALHASVLAFEHPITRERITIEAPLPDDLATFWQQVAGSPCLQVEGGL